MPVSGHAASPQQHLEGSTKHFSYRSQPERLVYMNDHFSDFAESLPLLDMQFGPSAQVCQWAESHVNEIPASFKRLPSAARFNAAKGPTNTVAKSYPQRVQQCVQQRVRLVRDHATARENTFRRTHRHQGSSGAQQCCERGHGCNRGRRREPAAA
jgi:hypothetical protein